MVRHGIEFWEKLWKWIKSDNNAGAVSGWKNYYLDMKFGQFEDLWRDGKVKLDDMSLATIDERLEEFAKYLYEKGEEKRGELVILIDKPVKGSYPYEFFSLAEWTDAIFDEFKERLEK